MHMFPTTFATPYTDFFARDGSKSSKHQNLGSMRFELSLESDVDDVAPTPTQPANIVQGELQAMTDMPVDILYEIFGHLHPQDLLNISRTTRCLRLIVTSRHSGHMWRSSLASVRALPPCPPDLTEIQYASLAFDDHCHFCLAPVYEVFWICRVRCCTKCIPKYFQSEGELELWIPREAIIEKPHSIFPYITSQQAFNTGGKSPLYFLPAAKEYLRELDDILLTKDDDALTKWMQEKKDIQSLRVSHAQFCQFWIYRLYRTCRPPQHTSRHKEMIPLILLLTLAFLWRDHIASMIL